MRVIGLTGGVGSGKSLVSGLFAELGAPIIDADLIARELVAPSGEALAEIVAQFGTDMLTPQGELDRRRLRERVFSDASARQRLEGILHPSVRRRIVQRLDALRAADPSVPYCIVVIPLLVEAGMADLVDQVVVVDCDPELQLQRVMQRDQCTREQAAAIVQAQLSRERRLARAHIVIDNSEDREAVKRQVHQLHGQWSQRGIS